MGDKIKPEGEQMDKMHKYNDGENVSLAVDYKTPRYLSRNKRNELVVPAIRVKKQPLHLLEHTKAPAVLHVSDENGRLKYLSNRFYLTGVQESRQEKAQIIETFGAPSYFFFGERARIYNFSGQLLETKSRLKNYRHKYLWATAFTDLYEKHIRGTRLAEAKNEVALTFKSIVLRGFILNLNIIHNSNNPMGAAFSFSMLVRSQDHLLPLRNSVGHDKNTIISSLYSADRWVKSELIAERLDTLSDEIDNAWEGLKKVEEALKPNVLGSIAGNDELTKAVNTDHENYLKAYEESLESKLTKINAETIDENNTIIETVIEETLSDITWGPIIQEINRDALASQVVSVYELEGYDYMRSKVTLDAKTRAYNVLKTQAIAAGEWKHVNNLMS